MKKNIFKKLVGLFTLVCIMSTFFVHPLQAATPAPATTTVVVKTELTDLLHPMDIPVNWTENTTMRTNTNKYFNAAVVTIIANSLQTSFLGPVSAYTVPATSICSAWYTLESQNAWMVIRYYWTPSSIQYSPYYIKKHIDYYSKSARLSSQKIAQSDTYYYSSVPY